MPESIFREIRFTDADVVNPDEYLLNVGCQNFKPWQLHDHGFTLAVVFAETLQDALDTAADKDKLNAFQISADEVDQEKHSFLGDACDPYDLESLDAIELPAPAFSFCALFNASLTK